MFNLYIRGGFPVIVEVDNGGRNRHVPFGIMCRDMPHSDDMRWFEVKPDVQGSKQDVYAALRNNEVIQHTLNPKKLYPNSSSEGHKVFCTVYYLSGEVKIFEVLEQN